MYHCTKLQLSVRRSSADMAYRLATLYLVHVPGTALGEGGMPRNACAVFQYTRPMPLILPSFDILRAETVIYETGVKTACTCSARASCTRSPQVTHRQKTIVHLYLEETDFLSPIKKITIQRTLPENIFTPLGVHLAALIIADPYGGVLHRPPSVSSVTSVGVMVW